MLLFRVLAVTTDAADAIGGDRPTRTIHGNVELAGDVRVG